VRLPALHVGAVEDPPRSLVLGCLELACCESQVEPDQPRSIFASRRSDSRERTKSAMPPEAERMSAPTAVPPTAINATDSVLTGICEAYVSCAGAESICAADTSWAPPVRSRRLNPFAPRSLAA